MKRYTLLEDGYAHTTGLKLKDVKEMVERYTRFFPESEYGFIPDQY